MSPPTSVSIPRVLVISEAPFGLDNGFGVTLRTFFADWPKDRMWQFHTSAHAAGDREFCPRIEYADLPGHRGRRHALPWLLGRTPVWRGHCSGRWLRRKLGQWRPEVVYALLFAGWTLAYAAWVADQLGCSLVVHVADDSLERLTMERAAGIKELLGRAQKRLVISQEMKLEYERRYGLAFEVLHNGAAEELFAGPAPPIQVNNDGVFTIRYLGSIVPTHHFHAMEDIAAAVKQMRKAGAAVRFEIWGGEWTRQHALSLVEEPAVSYCGAVDRGKGFDLLRTADFLVAPVSFAPEEFDFVRFSFPTKLPECLASGAPLLVYGPPGTAPVEFCRREGVGHVLCERSVPKLVSFFEQACAQVEAYKQKAARDRAWAREHVSGDAVRRRFHVLMDQASTMK